MNLDTRAMFAHLTTCDFSPCHPSMSYKGNIVIHFIRQLWQLSTTFDGQRWLSHLSRGGGSESYCDMTFTWPMTIQRKPIIEASWLGNYCYLMPDHTKKGKCTFDETSHNLALIRQYYCVVQTLIWNPHLCNLTIYPFSSITSPLRVLREVGKEPYRLKKLSSVLIALELIKERRRKRNIIEFL